MNVTPVCPIDGLYGWANFGSRGCPDLPLGAYCPQRNCASNGVYESDAIFSRIGGDRLGHHLALIIARSTSPNFVVQIHFLYISNL